MSNTAVEQILGLVVPAIIGKILGETLINILKMDPNLKSLYKLATGESYRHLPMQQPIHHVVESDDEQEPYHTSHYQQPSARGKIDNSKDGFFQKYLLKLAVFGGGIAVNHFVFFHYLDLSAGKYIGGLAVLALSTLYHFERKADKDNLKIEFKNILNVCKDFFSSLKISVSFGSKESGQYV